MVDADDLRPDDSFERVQHGAGSKSFDRAGPVRAVAQTHGVVIAIGKSESEEQATGGVGSERVDEFLAQQPHRRGAQDDDALFVEPDDALVGAEIEELRRCSC